LFRRQVGRQVNLAGLGIETYQPILFGERQNLRDDFLGLFRHDGHRVHRVAAPCLMIRATCSSRQAEPRRVRSDWRFRAAAIPRNVWPLWRR
jgi:hypothetical protein